MSDNKSIVFSKKEMAGFAPDSLGYFLYNLRKQQPLPLEEFVQIKVEEKSMITWLMDYCSGAIQWTELQRIFAAINITAQLSDL